MAKLNDSNFMSELEAASHSRPSFWAHLLLFAIILFIISAIIWAHYAPLEEVVRGQGRVIPSSKLQKVQNLEGGIVSEILIQEGEQVTIDQPLITIDDTRFRSELQEDSDRLQFLRATIARLEAEITNEAPNFAPDLDRVTKQNQTALLQSRREELATKLQIIAKQAEQKRQEVVEVDSRIAKLQTSLNLGKEELAILAPIVDQGAASKLELIRIQREVNDLETALISAKESLPRLKAVLGEYEQRAENERISFLTRAQQELNDVEGEANPMQKRMAARQDRLQRTQVRSPVNGTVQRLLVNTIGGVIQPGMDLVEIVPIDDSLLISAQIKPSDIAFLRPNLPAKVKITAYDYTIYGMLEGKLIHISPDSVMNEQGERYYEIQVRTDRNALYLGDQPNPIIVGMVAEIDILTGTKTVLQYLLKPILRAKHSAMRER